MWQWKSKAKVKVILSYHNSTAMLSGNQQQAEKSCRLGRIREVDLGRHILRKGSFEVLVLLHQQETNMRLQLILGKEGTREIVLRIAFNCPLSNRAYRQG